MSDFDHATDNYSHSAVPEEDTVSTWQITAIMVGIAITLPGFLSGAKIMMALGTVWGFLAIVTGGIILSIIAAANSYVAVRRRLSTYQILDRAFGPKGKLIISFIMALTLLGWFGVTASLFGKAIALAFQELFDMQVAEEIIMVAGCALMILTTIFGLKAISILARISVPLMLIVLAMGVYFVLDGFTYTEIISAPGKKTDNIGSFGAAVSITVGSFMVGVTIVPDYARYLRKKSQTVTFAFISFMLFNSLIMLLAGIPGLLTGQEDLITSLYQTGLGIPALFVMAFATWTTNVGNLYSTSLSAAQLFPKLADWQITVAAGTIGGILALMGIMDLFVGFLIILGITIPPIAGIYITDELISEKMHKGYKTGPTIKDIPVIPFSVWALAILVASSTGSGAITLTTIPALDSFLTACLCYPLAMTYFARKTA